VLTSAASRRHDSAKRCNGRRRCRSGRLAGQRYFSECCRIARARPDEGASGARGAWIPATRARPSLGFAPPRRPAPVPKAVQPAHKAAAEQHLGALSARAETSPSRSLLLRRSSRPTSPPRGSPLTLHQVPGRVLHDHMAVLQARLLGQKNQGPGGEPNAAALQRSSAMAWSLIAAANRRSGFSTARAPLLVGQDSVAVAATIHAANGAAIEADEDLVLICE